MRFGLIGAGGIARHHLSRLTTIPDVDIVALADSSEASIAKTREAAGDGVANAVAYADYRDMLEKSRPEAVLIATPHTQHFKQTIDSLDAGAHVLLEKPMVTTVAQSKLLLDKLKTTDRIVALAYQRHGSPEFRYIKKCIASGEFGDVQFINALQHQDWRKLTIGSWRQDPELSGGGQINDSGSHLLDIILWVTGLAPDQVSAFMDFKGTPVDINSAVTIKFVNGALGTISIVGDMQGWWEDVSIWCEHGAFFVRNGGDFRVQMPDGKVVKPEAADMPAGTDVDTNFIRAIQGLEEIAAPPICGLRTIELTEAAWESAAAGGKLTAVKRSL